MSLSLVQSKRLRHISHVLSGRDHSVEEKLRLKTLHLAGQPGLRVATKAPSHTFDLGLSSLEALGAPRSLSQREHNFHTIAVLLDSFSAAELHRGPLLWCPGRCSPDKGPKLQTLGLTQLLGGTASLQHWPPAPFK